MQGQLPVEVLLVGDQRLRIDQLEVPIFVSNSCLNPFHLGRPFQLERVKVAENFQVRERFDDIFGDLAGDVDGAEDDERFDVLHAGRPLKNYSSFAQH